MPTKSNKILIQKTLSQLISKDNKPFVAMLSGEWGIGKTYFWEEFSKDYLTEKKVVNISLFGKNTLADIEGEIIATLYRHNKSLKKYTKHFHVQMGSLLSLFNESDFKNIIICFDDFERLSDKISLKDVMGLISQFKEQKKCKIILILNEGELDKISDIEGKKHSDVFALYKEKIVDYNFNYQPNQEEIFEALKEDLENIKFCEARLIYDFFTRIKLKNIRIMKQALYYLGSFSFIGEREYHIQVIHDFVKIALNLFVFKAKSNFDYSNFLRFKEYKDEERIKVMKAYEKYLNDYIFVNYLSTDNELEKYIYYFIDTQHIETEEIIALLDTNNLHRDKENVRENLSHIIQGIEYDLKASLKEDTQKLYTLLAENKTLIPHIVDTQKLKSCFAYIKAHHRDLMSDDFIKEYLLAYTSSSEEESSKDRAFFLLLLQKKHNQWNEEELKDLYLLDVEKYTLYMEESVAFFYESFAFFQRHEYRPHFSFAISNIKEALHVLRAKDANMKWKIDRILKEKGLSLADDTIAFDSEGM